MILRWDMLGSLARSVARAWNSRMKGDELIATDETIDARQKICARCEFLAVNPVTGDQCRLCGCFISWKTLLKEEACPDKPPRWPDVV